jgi:hypothetical protein
MTSQEVVSQEPGTCCASVILAPPGPHCYWSYQQNNWDICCPLCSCWKNDFHSNRIDYSYIHQRVASGKGREKAMTQAIWLATTRSKDSRQPQERGGKEKRRGEDGPMSPKQDSRIITTHGQVMAAPVFAHRDQGKLPSSTCMWFKTLHSNHFYVLSKVKYKRLFLIMNLANKEGMSKKQQMAEWLAGVLASSSS